MSFNFIKVLNIVLSGFYTLVSLNVFLLLQLSATALPLAGGILLLRYYYSGLLDGSPPPSYLILVIVGAFFASVNMAFNFVKGIRYVLQPPERESKTSNPKILSLVKRVAFDLGMPPFDVVCINSDINISTSYVGKEKCLNLCVISLLFLTQEEIKSVIAHEYAHHHHNAMLINRTHNRAAAYFKIFIESVDNTLVYFDNPYKKPGVVRPGKLARLNAFGFEHLYTYVSFPLIILNFSSYIFSRYMWLMEVITRNKSYEYYCDLIAARYLSGNILSSALHKVFTLNIALNILLDESDLDDSLNLNHPIEEYYLHRVRSTYDSLQAHMPECYSRFAHHETRSHPSLVSRLKRIASIGLMADLSTPVVSESEVISLLSLASESLFVEKMKRHHRAKDCTIKSLRTRDTSQESEKAAIVIIRNSSVIYIMYSFDIYINETHVGRLKNNQSGKFYVIPGQNNVSLKVSIPKAAKNVRPWSAALDKYGARSKVLSLDLASNEEVEVDCWPTLEGICLVPRE